MKKAAKKINPPQHQSRPGVEKKMHPEPVFDNHHPGSGKLTGKVLFITGGDSGIGKAVAILFAKEGADVAIVYLSETQDAQETKDIIENTYGRTCLLIRGDVSKELFCKKAIQTTIGYFKKIDILINNAAKHYEEPDIAKMEMKRMRETFEVNIFPMFYLTKYAIPYLKQGACIINTSSVTAYRGSPKLLDYSATKGAIVSFTRSLATNLSDKGIRVNGVAPGPIWTPLIASSFKPGKVAKHGSEAPMERAGQPVEVAPAYLFLATDDASYISGQFIHPNGGEIVNG